MQRHNKISNFKSQISKVNGREIILVGALISAVLVERLVWDLGANVELVTVATFIAGTYLSKPITLLVPLLSLAISDIFLGNQSIMLFTWSAYFLIGLVIPITKKYATTSSQKILLATGGGILAGVWFYLWTNFGVWLLDSYGMYSKDMSGLFRSYLMGLPFLKAQVMNNLFIVPLMFTSIEVLNLVVKKLVPNIRVNSV